MEPGDNQLPKPYLNREETNKRLEILGFEFTEAYHSGQLVDTPEFRDQFVALQELIAGAIGEWAAVEASDDIRIDQVNQELLEWAEEWLVG